MSFSYEVNGMMSVSGLPAANATLSWPSNKTFIVSTADKGRYHVTLKKGNQTLDSKTFDAGGVEIGQLFQFVTGVEGEAPVAGTLVRWSLDAATRYTLSVTYSGKFLAGLGMIPIQCAGNGHAEFVWTGKGDGTE